MPNNSLWIGDATTNEYMLRAKGWASGWELWGNYDLLYEFFISRYLEGEIGQSTNLFLFTEYDEDYDSIIKNWKLIV